MLFFVSPREDIIAMPATGTAARASPARVVVVTYNVHRCIGGDGRYSPDRILEVLTQANADVICLQEVSSRHTSRGDDQAHLLAHALGYSLCVGPTLSADTGSVGNVLLTRFPIARVDRVDLTVVPKSEPRGAIVARVEAAGHPLLVATTHLGLQRRERSQQLGRVFAAIGSDTVATLLAGDLNEWRRRGPCSRELVAAFGTAPAPRTFPARRPVFRLDRIYAGRGARVCALEAVRTPLTRVASDHLPVRAVVEIAPGVRDQ